jgi:autotransporter-associated beta strand protein
MITQSTATQTFGTVSVTKIGAGDQKLFGANTYTGPTTVQGGRLILVKSDDPNDGRDAWAPALTGAGGANVQSGKLVFDYSASTTPAPQVQSLLTTAYGSGFASGQIRSTTADASHGLGWRDDTTAKQVTVMYTFYGDANLDGTVDTVDFNLLAASFSQSNQIWGQGDFNYDGAVDTVDFNLLAANFAKALPAASGSAPLASTLAAAVPEPTGFALCTLTASAALAVRRRRRS